jgi:hypothetical protein
MKENNIVRDKSYAFALNVIKTYQIICSEMQDTYLPNEVKNYLPMPTNYLKLLVPS